MRFRPVLVNLMAVFCQHGAMAEHPTISPLLVQAAVRAARTVLREMDAEQVPAALRRVQASSARRLPPPLAAKLVAQLASDAWFRQQVADHSDDWDMSADQRDQRASALLVLQPTGWEAALEEIATAAGDEKATLDVQAMGRRLSTVEAERDAARSKVKQLNKTLERQRAEATRRQSELKAERAGRQGPDPELKEAHGRLGRLESDNAKLAEALTDAEVRIHRLKAELLRARRSRGDLPEEEIRRWGKRDSLELARQLDALANAVVPDAAVEPGTPQSGPRFELPAGVAPDSAAAIEWLLARRSPTTLIVDGYNVTWLADQASFADVEGRTRLVRHLAKLRRGAQGPVRIVAIFDSQYGTFEPSHGAQVEVRFAHSADDEVRHLAAVTEGDVVVVSTDREVREGAERPGVIGLWSQALVEWRS